jgi:hypothetical protein
MITLYNEKNEKIKLISTFEFNDADMGESSISATVSFDKEQDFHPDWYVVYNGEKFRLGVRKPTGKKDTSSLQTSYTLVFKSEREDLKRYTFMDFVELGTGNPQPSSYNVSLYATLSEFVDRFNTNLRYYMGSRWKMVLPDGYVEDGNAISVAFENASLWDVLLRVYEAFGVRWVIRSAGDVLQIQVGFQEVEIEHIFEYGKGNGLVSVERNNALERIITRLRGRGSEKNLPPDYFHTGDPDTNSFLQATFFKNLMPKSYRDYIRGYNAGSGTGSWAYNQGVADRVSGRNISPVDYAISDKEDLWGVSYGAIEPNEQIYPTLQGATRNGVRLDEVLSVEQVLVDGVREPQNTITVGIGTGGQESSSGKCGNSLKNNYLEDCRDGIEFTVFTDRFQVTNPINTAQIRITMSPSYIGDDGLPVPVEFGSTSTVRSSAELQLVDFTGSTTGKVVRTQTISDTDSYLWELDDIPAGDYRFRSNVVWSADIQREEYDPTAGDVVVNVDTRLTGASVKEYARVADKGEFKETFDIEIRDVWGVTRNAGESDEDYTYRVWAPRAVSEDMAIMFSDGLLAGEDYEFRIVGFNSDADNLRQTITSAIKPTNNGGWKLTLQKSDAELNAGNIYLPNTMQNAKAGDHFFFVNISMPYAPYVYDAEERLQAYLDSQLSLKDEEYPSFTITPSKIFCSSFTEADKIQAGAKIRVRNTALVGESYISLYIQSLTKRYSVNSLNPEWNLTISDLVVASGNPVETLQGEVDVLSQRVYSNRNAVQEAVRSLSSTFLRKDGIADTSYSPTEFKKPVKLGEGISDRDFINGDISGKGFGVYTDSDGNRVIEADILVGRVGARFNEVVINQVTYSAGKQVFSSAGMVVDRVEDADASWRCYFDTKNATVRNYFAVGDGAFCQRFVDTGVRQYWARVVAIGPDYIDISKTDRMQGSFDPIVGDNIAQLGNSTDKSRQAALVIDETRDGGGLVTWYDDITNFTLSGKDSVNIGRIDGKTWLQVYGAGYIGARDESQYVKYEDGKVTIKGKLEIGTTLSDGRNLEQAIKDAKPENYEQFVSQVTKDLQGLQQQVDGAIDSYFEDYAPTLDNYPASEWDTIAEKEAHLNDTFTNLVDGRSWRWTTDGWVEITDTATTEALRLAGLAKDTADGKRRVFIDTPYPPYDLGDLWAGGSTMPLMRCISAKGEGEFFSADDWDYADNTTKELAGFAYLKEALKESTTIEGGLIQSALLMLGYTDGDTFKVMSGTNGIYKYGELGGGIAAWYGGPMADKEADSALVEYAQSLFRFDGSGYLAGGNITWDKDGAGQVAGGDIRWDKDGVITLAQTIKISGDANETLSSILAFINTYREILSIDADGDVYIGGVNKNNQKRNFYVYGGLSFGGKGTSGSGGSGATALSGLSDVVLTTLSNGQSLVYENGYWVNKKVGLDTTQLWNILGSSGVEKLHIDRLPDLSSKYLSVSGGTMSGRLIIESGYDSKIVLNNNDADNKYQFISFMQNGEEYGLLGTTGADILLWNYKLILHEGNYADTTDKRYLQLSGGTINSTTTTATPLTIISSAANAAIRLRNASIGSFIGVNSSGNWFVTDDTWSSTYPLIHSGNIGSYAMRYYGTNMPTAIVNYVGYGKPEQGWNTFGPAITWGYANYYAELQIDTVYQNIYVRNSNGGALSDWKQIAFTDSNVASATKLQDNTAYTAWGQTFFQNGVPTSVTGKPRFVYTETNSSVITESASAIVLGSNGTGMSYNSGISFNGLAGYGGYDYTYAHHSHAWIGLGPYTTTNAAECYPLVFATNESITANAALTERMRIMPNGNVLIGTTEDNGGKLQVAGDIVIKTDGGYPSFIIQEKDAVTGWALSYRKAEASKALRLYRVNNATYTPIVDFLPSGNVLIGTTADSGYKLDVAGNARLMSVVTEFNDEINRYGGNLYLQHRGSIVGSQGDARTGNILMCGNGGNILIGTFIDNGYKLDVNGTLNAGETTLTTLTTSGNTTIGSSATHATLNIYGGLNVNVGDTILNGDVTQTYGNALFLDTTVDKLTAYYQITAHHNIIQDAGWEAQFANTTVDSLISQGTIEGTTITGTKLKINAGGFSEVLGYSYDGIITNGKIYGSHLTLRTWWQGISEYKYGVVEAGAIVLHSNVTPTEENGYPKDCGIHLSDAENLYLYGNLVVTGAITFGSDARYKDKLSDATISLETIANAPLFNYKWNDGSDSREHLGTTAQYWYSTAFKNAVIPTNSEKKWTMSYSEIAMGNTIVLARELLQTKQNHETRLERLERENKELNNKVVKLENELNQYRRAEYGNNN